MRENPPNNLLHISEKGIMNYTYYYLYRLSYFCKFFTKYGTVLVANICLLLSAPLANGKNPQNEEDFKKLYVEYFLSNKSLDKPDPPLPVQEISEKVMLRAEKELRKKLVKELQKQSYDVVKNWESLNNSIFDGVKKSYMDIHVPQEVSKNDGKNYLQFFWEIHWSDLLQEMKSRSLEKSFPKSMPTVLIMMGKESPKMVLDPLSFSLKKRMVEVCSFRNIPIVEQKQVYDFLSKYPFRTHPDYGLRPEQLAEIGLKLHSDLIIRMSVSTKVKKSAQAEVILRVQIHRTKDATVILSKKIVKVVPNVLPKENVPLDVVWLEYFAKKFPSWVAHTLCAWQNILQNGIPYELVIANASEEDCASWIAQLKSYPRMKDVFFVKKSPKDKYLLISLVFSGLINELQECVLSRAQEVGISFVRYENRSNKLFLRKM